MDYGGGTPAVSQPGTLTSIRRFQIGGKIIAGVFPYPHPHPNYTASLRSLSDALKRTRCANNPVAARIPRVVLRLCGARHYLVSSARRTGQRCSNCNSHKNCLTTAIISCKTYITESTSVDPVAGGLGTWAQR
jgi:hypothetical protein